MKTISAVRRFLAVFPATLASCLLLRAQTQTTDAYRQDRILVKPASNQITNVHASLGARVLRKWPRFGNLQVVQVSPGNSVTNMIQQYKSSGSVQYAEPDYIGKLGDHNNPNDPSYTDGTLWGLNNTGQNGGTPNA